MKTKIKKKKQKSTDNESCRVDCGVMPPPRTKHNLIFEVAEWKIDNILKHTLDRLENNDSFPFIPWLLYRVGTVTGQWRCTPLGYEILSFVNDKKGNGHLEDVFEWFEYACRRDKKPLLIREIWNKRFYKHLIEKRGFKPYRKEDAIKTFAAA
jgi:hypothetical protein